MARSEAQLDEIDRLLIAGLRRRPRSSMTELARTAGVARGTAYARLARLESTGVIEGYGPEIDPSKAGYDVLAFCTLEIAQGSHDETIGALAEISEILEVHTVTGLGDIHCRIVARTNDHLHAVLQRVAGIPSVERSQTQLSLRTDLQRTAADLIIDGDGG